MEKKPQLTDQELLQKIITIIEGNAGWADKIHKYNGIVELLRLNGYSEL